MLSLEPVFLTEVWVILIRRIWELNCHALPYLGLGEVLQRPTKGFCYSVGLWGFSQTDGAALDLQGWGLVC